MAGSVEREEEMRLSVTIDSKLLKCAMNASGCHTKREMIECALQALVRKHRRAFTSRADQLWERSPQVQRRLRKALKELHAGQASTLKAFAKRHNLR
jgi:Arc/MetJ family transcription regulator